MSALWWIIGVWLGCSLAVLVCLWLAAGPLAKRDEARRLVEFRRWLDEYGRGGR